MSKVRKVRVKKRFLFVLVFGIVISQPAVTLYGTAGSIQDRELPHSLEQSDELDEILDDMDLKVLESIEREQSSMSIADKIKLGFYYLKLQSEQTKDRVTKHFMRNKKSYLIATGSSLAIIGALCVLYFRLSERSTGESD